MTGIKPTANDSIEFWKQQSAKELRNQLKLRYPDRFYKEWPFKEKEDLLKIIEELIKNKEWNATIDNKDRAYWESLTIPQIKEQIMIRGQRWTGAKVKKDYLEIMYSILGI